MRATSRCLADVAFDVREGVSQQRPAEPDLELDALELVVTVGREPLSEAALSNTQDVDCEPTRSIDDSPCPRRPVQTDETALTVVP